MQERKSFLVLVCLESFSTKLLKGFRLLMVVIGAFQSPQLLMLSGIGPADQLAKFGIPVIKDLSGVGQNMQ